jgi:hypothetical protein
MEIGHARDDGTVARLQPFPIGIRLDGGDSPCPVELDRDIMGPAGWQQGLLGKKSGNHPWLPSVCLYMYISLAACLYLQKLIVV